MSPPAWPLPPWLYPLLVCALTLPAVLLALHRRSQRVSDDTGSPAVEVAIAMPAHLPDQLSPGLAKRLEALQGTAGDAVQLIGPCLWWELERDPGDVRFFLARHAGGRVAPAELAPLTASEAYPSQLGCRLTLRSGYGLRFAGSAAGWVWGQRPNDAAKAFLRKFA